jgi:hypothetical protein
VKWCRNCGITINTGVYCFDCRPANQTYVYQQQPPPDTRIDDLLRRVMILEEENKARKHNIGVLVNCLLRNDITKGEL